MAKRKLPKKRLVIGNVLYQNNSANQVESLNDRDLAVKVLTTGGANQDMDKIKGKMKAFEVTSYMDIKEQEMIQYAKSDFLNGARSLKSTVTEKYRNDVATSANMRRQAASALREMDFQDDKEQQIFIRETFTAGTKRANVKTKTYSALGYDTKRHAPNQPVE